MRHLRDPKNLALCALVVIFNCFSANSFAAPLDLLSQVTTEEDSPSKQTNEPTPIEEFSPSNQGQVIPGTEPLYDQGITVTEIDISGNKIIPSDTILKAMDTKPGSLYSKRRLQNDLKKIYDIGYFTEHLRVVPVATRDGVHLKIEVEENPAVNSVSFVGNEELKSNEFDKFFADQIGRPQNVNNINKGIQRIEETYKDKGYVLARVSDIKEDPPGSITLTIDEGKLNKITFSGNRKTKDYVVRRAMAQKEGDVYNEKVVEDDLKRIFSLQSFADVRRVIKASPAAPGEYELVVELDEKKTGAISLGGGMDTGTGVFGSVGYSDPNFLGRGENFSSIFSVGSGVLGSSRNTVRRGVFQFQTNWSTPSVGESLNALNASIYARELGSFNVPLAIERRIGGTIGWARPLESLSGVTVGADLGYEDVHLREGADNGEIASRGVSATERQRELQDGATAFLSPNFTYDSRDNRFNPSKGWLITVNPRFALATTGDIDSYGSATANLRRYLKVTKDITFALNGQAGSSIFGNIPLFNMYRLGGAYTVRGFQEGGIGIGEGYLLGSAEIRTKLPILKKLPKFPFYDMVSLAFFADAGYLIDEDPSNSFFDRPGEAVSVGAGLRINLPAVGPLRIDLAFPLTTTNDLDQRINFGVGQKF